MPDVRIHVAGTAYDVRCGEGEEDRLHTLAGMVHDAASRVRGGSDIRNLLFAALHLADELDEARGQPAQEAAELEALRAKNAEYSNLINEMEANLEALTNARMNDTTGQQLSEAREQLANLTEQYEARIAVLKDGFVRAMDQMSQRLTKIAGRLEAID